MEGLVADLDAGDVFDPCVDGDPFVKVSYSAVGVGVNSAEEVTRTARPARG